jgi:hypothetical protein
MPDSCPLILAFPAIAPCIAQSACFWCPGSGTHTVLPAGEGIQYFTSRIIIAILSFPGFQSITRRRGVYGSPVRDAKDENASPQPPGDCALVNYGRHGQSCNDYVDEIALFYLTAWFINQPLPGLQHPGDTPMPYLYAPPPDILHRMIH